MLDKLWRSPNFHRWGLPLVIFLTAFLPRAIYPVSRSYVWYERSIYFSKAIIDQDWATTYQRYHPGVITMWLSGTGLQLFSRLHGELTLEQILGQAPTKPGTPIALLTAAVVPLALFIALCIALTYPLLSRLVRRQVAVAAAFFLALDPFYITYSKVVHPDGVLATCMLMCTLFLLVYLREGSLINLILSGLFAGLAFLSKSPSLFLIPFTALLVTVGTVAPYLDYEHGIGSPRGWAEQLFKIGVTLLIWGLTSALVFFLAWPAMWVNSREILGIIVDRIIYHTTTPHGNPVFFNGTITQEDPGTKLYLATMAWKTTLVTLPFIVAGLILLGRRFRSTEAKVMLAFIGFALFFTLQMSLGQFKQVAYILPVFPALGILAAFGLVWTADAAEQLSWWRERRWLSAALIVLGIGLQAAIVLSRFPYTGTDFNLLLGGPAVAQNILPLQDHGEGLDLAAKYLSGLPHGQDKTATIFRRSAPVFRREFIGRTTTEFAPWADYRIYYVNQIIRELGDEEWHEAWLADRTRDPLMTVEFDGITYVWVYGNLPSSPADEGPRHELYAHIGDHIELKSAQLNAEELVPGDTLTVVLNWESDGELEESYTVFNHIVDANGKLVAQQDNVPLFGIRPTYTWREEEVLEDSYLIDIPEDLPPGDYRLLVGMYDSNSLERLPAFGGDGMRWPHDSIEVGELYVGLEPSVE